MNKVVQSEAETAIDLKRLGRAARAASKILANAPTGQKNELLRTVAKILRARSDTILRENAIDLEFAARDCLQGPLLDRLELTPERVDAMVDGLIQVAGLPDPVGEVSGLRRQPSGIEVGRMRVPLGVIGIIYESRPNVTADAAAVFQFWEMAERIIQIDRPRKIKGVTGYNGTRKGRSVFGSRRRSTNTPATVAPIMSVSGRPM